MGFWGWRPLLIAVFMSVWVAGCNIVSDAAPRTSPTPSPRVTLTLRRIATATASPSPRALVRPTVLAATPEPPAASATPVTHTIADGDTLGGIALRFGISVDALREANDNLDPRALQPGQALVIPVAAGGTQARPPTATATPPDMALPDPACYETPAGALLCLGLVENRLETPLEQIEVLVQVYNEAGVVLRESELEVEQALLAPGESAPYRAYFDLDYDTAAGVSATLRRADAAANADARFLPIEVEDVAFVLESGRTMVSATLHNRTTEPAENVRIAVTLSDDANRVVGYRLSSVTDYLPAQDSIDIRLAIVTQVALDTPAIDIRVEARRGSRE